LPSSDKHFLRSAYGGVLDGLHGSAVLPSQKVLQPIFGWDGRSIISFTTAEIKKTVAQQFAWYQKGEDRTFFLVILQKMQVLHDIGGPNHLFKPGSDAQSHNFLLQKRELASCDETYCVDPTALHYTQFVGNDTEHIAKPCAINGRWDELFPDVTDLYAATPPSPALHLIQLLLAISALGVGVPDAPVRCSIVSILEALLLSKRANPPSEAAEGVSASLVPWLPDLRGGEFLVDVLLTRNPTLEMYIVRAVPAEDQRKQPGLPTYSGWETMKTLIESPPYISETGAPAKWTRIRLADLFVVVLASSVTRYTDACFGTAHSSDDIIQLARFLQEAMIGRVADTLIEPKIKQGYGGYIPHTCRDLLEMSTRATLPPHQTSSADNDIIVQGALLTTVGFAISKEWCRLDVVWNAYESAVLHVK
jgi:hypothetical protein